MDLAGVSSIFKGYTGANPFRDSQARNYADFTIRNEFIVTPMFRSLLNPQHEILVGTRGSGKTVLLRMLAFSNLRHVDDFEIQETCARREFIAFYVPLHLEFISKYFLALPELSERKEYFQFTFNCAAADAFAKELEALIEASFESEEDQRLGEARIVEELCSLWQLRLPKPVVSIENLRKQILLVLRGAQAWTDGSDYTARSSFKAPLFGPIVDAIKVITPILRLDPDRTHWAACVDEGEFLDEQLITTVNSFMRSSKRPLVLKMATLPFRHRTLATDVDGVEVQPEGNDFNYRTVDLDPDTEEFARFTDQLACSRLLRLNVHCSSVAEFLGTVGKDQHLDYFLREFKAMKWTQEDIVGAIIANLSSERSATYTRYRAEDRDLQNPFYKRFAPLFYLREMYKRSKVGARKVGWFAGASTLRLMSDGNARRFIQLMNALFEGARQRELKPKTQHQILVAFARQTLQSAVGLPMYGPVVRALIQRIGEILHTRVHDGPLVDGGCAFQFSRSSLALDGVREAAELAIQYSLISASVVTAHHLESSNKLRLSYLHAAIFWLPMRRGDAITITDARLVSGLESAEEASSVVLGLSPYQLQLFGA